MSGDLDQLAASFGEADETVDLSDTIAEAWLALLFFWALGLTVLYALTAPYQHRPLPTNKADEVQVVAGIQKNKHADNHKQSKKFNQHHAEGMGQERKSLLQMKHRWVQCVGQNCRDSKRHQNRPKHPQQKRHQQCDTDPEGQAFGGLDQGHVGCLRLRNIKRSWHIDQMRGRLHLK